MSSGFTAMQKIEALAIGQFDGIHLGHKELIRRIGPKGALLVIDSGRANLTPGEYRKEYVSAPLFFYKLEEIRQMEAEAFLQKIKSDFPALRKIVVGYDFRFGKDRRYDAKELKRWFDGEVEIVEQVMVFKESVHSSTIRKYIKEGHIKKANAMLGHPYKIFGDVVAGQGIGKKVLFPTINLDVKEFLLPKEGVYATLTQVDSHSYPSVTFIGKRVTTDGGFAIESHIIDHEILPSLKASVVFLERIRSNRRFESYTALRDAIEQDIKTACEILREHII